MRHRDTAGAERQDGLKRLSTLTWRITQISALATVAFATLFTRSAPVAASTPAPAPGGSASPGASASPSSSPSPSASASPTSADLLGLMR